VEGTRDGGERTYADWKKLVGSTVRDMFSSGMCRKSVYFVVGGTLS